MQTLSNFSGSIQLITRWRVGMDGWMPAIVTRVSGSRRLLSSSMWWFLYWVVGFGIVADVSYCYDGNLSLCEECEFQFQVRVLWYVFTCPGQPKLRILVGCVYMYGCVIGDRGIGPDDDRYVFLRFRHHRNKTSLALGETTRHCPTTTQNEHSNVIF